jgi:hypothetical protein
VSLAHAAVTHSRGWCADSPIRRGNNWGQNNRTIGRTIGVKSQFSILYLLI